MAGVLKKVANPKAILVFIVFLIIAMFLVRFVKAQVPQTSKFLPNL